MNASNWRNANKDVRCLRKEIIGGEERTSVVFVNPDIVRNEYLFKVTGLVVDDPQLDKKMNPEKYEPEEKQISPPVQPLHEVINPPTDEKKEKEEAPVLNQNEMVDNTGLTVEQVVDLGKQTAASFKNHNEKIDKILNQSDDGKPKRKGGRKKGSKNKPVNI